MEEGAQLAFDKTQWSHNQSDPLCHSNHPKMPVISALLWSAVVLLLSYRFYLNRIKRPLNYPPGPAVRLSPLQDYALLLLLNHRHLQRAASRLAHFYRTKVLGLFLAGLPTVIVRDGEIARKLLTRRELDGRPDLFLARMITPLSQSEVCKNIFSVQKKINKIP